MLELPQSKLADVEANVSYEEAPIWISLLVPNPTLTEQFLGDEDTPDDMPNIMLHDWFYVAVDGAFDESGLFYTEDEPFRMGYDEEPYGIQDTHRTNQRLVFQEVVALDGSLDEDFQSWLENACDDIGIDANTLCNQLEQTLVEDAESRGSHAVVRATRFEQSLPP